MGVPAPILGHLRESRAGQLENQLRAGPLWRSNPWGLVRTTSLGEPVSASVVTHHFQQLLADVGLPKKRFHDLRHSAASLMLVQGVPMLTAMEILGHREIGVTANLYSHVAPELKRDAAERVSELLRGRG